MKKLLILLFPLFIFSQETTLVGDVDCDGQITSEDASLILQFVTSSIEELPCEENMTGLTPEQLQNMINMINDQINTNSEQSISMIGPMYTAEDYPDFIHFAMLDYGENYNGETIFYIDAIKFCGQLNYNGFDDWMLPSIRQVQDYIENYGGQIIIPNYFNDIRSFWMKSDFQASLNTAPYLSIRGQEYEVYPGHAHYLYNTGFTEGGIYCFCAR